MPCDSRGRSALFVSMFVVIVVVILTGVMSSRASAQGWQDEVNLAIDRGIEFLLSRQAQDGHFKAISPDNTGWNGSYPMGVTSLAVYSLLKSGVGPEDPAIVRALDVLQYMEMKKVYSVAMLALALDATGQKKHETWIRSAGRWLENNVHPKAKIWGYPGGNPDMSNTQYGALGMWVAEKHGFRAKRRTWQDLVEALGELQHEDGAWGYARHYLPESSGTMTTSGITVLWCAIEHFKKKKLGKGVIRQAEKQLDRAWAWLDHVFTGTGNPSHPNGVLRDSYPLFQRSVTYHYYYLFGIERISAFFKRKKIAKRDWYREGATWLLRRERSSGNWGGLANSALALLFLRRATSTGFGDAVTDSRPAPIVWRHTFVKPGADWMRPGFDDRAWVEAPGAFGSRLNTNEGVRTTWPGGEIWLRREFIWRDDDPNKFRLFSRHDDGIEVYVNGVLACKRPQWANKWVELKIRPEARATVRRGKNLIAVAGSDIGGACLVDIRLRDTGARAIRANESVAEKRKRWWSSSPRSDVPWVTRWLALGPIPDAAGEALLANNLETETGPREGSRTKGKPWQAIVSESGFVDLGDALRRRDRAVYGAFTWLMLKDDANLVLWLGADDGARVVVDGEVVFSHFAPKASKADEFPIAIRLGKGQHGVMVEVYNHEGTTGFSLRITDRDGNPVPGLRTVLDAKRPDLAAAVRAQASAFSLDEVLEYLPLDNRPKLDLGKRADLERLAVTGSRAGYPKWTKRFDRKKKIYQPHPGAKGIVTVRAIDATTPVRLLRKYRLPSQPSKLRVKVSPEAHQAIGKAGFRLRLGVFDGKQHWPVSQDVKSAGPANAKSWATVDLDLAPWVGKDVLLMVECGYDAKLGAVDFAYIDSIAVVK